MAGYIVGTMRVANGWETKSPTEALALHVTYWFQSRQNQGKVLGNVPSFYALVKQHGQNPERLIEETELALTNYIKELFPDTLVKVSKENKTGEVNQYTLIISSRIVSDGVSYDLASAVLITGEQYKLIDTARLA